MTRKGEERVKERQRERVTEHPPTRGIGESKSEAYPARVKADSDTPPSPRSERGRPKRLIHWSNTRVWEEDGGGEGKVKGGIGGRGRENER